MPIVGTFAETSIETIFTLEATNLIVLLPAGKGCGKIFLKGTDTEVPFTNEREPVIQIAAGTAENAPKFDFALYNLPESELATVVVNLMPKNGVLVDYPQELNTISKGSNFTCQFTPIDGYKISSVWINNVKQDFSDNQVYNLILNNIQVNTTVHVIGVPD